MQINVCIFGVSGYTGAQLIHFLAKHKFVNITGIFGYETIGQKIRNLFPSLKNLPDLTGSKSNKYQARMFLMDYHNIRGTSTDEVARSNTASWKVTGV